MLDKILDSWPPTRDEALRRLQDFLPHAGRDYATSRNFDLGPADRSNVSTLSPYLRHRLIREDEVVAAVLGRHGLHAAEKFLQEVCWRTYWKGWLELRPSVWEAYLDEVASLTSSLDQKRDLGGRWEAATTGRTGIACFDAWARELVNQGYLHNHARMWFASLWIFTLKLPWQLGADFFLQHLLDGDPATNTLSWRWVAGIQTPGKTYLARSENISRYTEGRFTPRERIAEYAVPIEGELPSRPRKLPVRDRPADDPSGLLITEEDLHPESLSLPGGIIRALGVLGPSANRSKSVLSPHVFNFAAGAIEDSLKRAEVHFDAPTEQFSDRSEEEVVDWANRLGFRQLITADAPVGFIRSKLDKLDNLLGATGVRLIRIRRSWDEALWPLATGGYFTFKARLSDQISRLVNTNSD